MGVTVTFSYAGWLAMFPEFNVASMTEPLAQGYFDIAVTMHANDGSGPIATDAMQTSLLNVLTAHIAQLFFTATGAQPAQLVGRIAQATEGSVSVSVELPANLPAAAAWFSQTKYGLMYWQMTAPYRAFQYRLSSNNKGPVNLPWAGVPGTY